MGPELVRHEDVSLASRNRGRRLPGALVISLDFEQHWGMRDKRVLDEGLKERLARVPEVVEGTLDTFQRHGVHATWATVGMLFCESPDGLHAAAPRLKPAYLHANLNPYGEPVGPDERSDPAHFALAMIRLVRSTPGQEIATHTFSHFYCLEHGATPA